MLKRIRNLAVLAFALGAVGLAFPAPSFAQYREFTGRIDNVNNRRVIVDNRMGDKVSFERVDESEVEGEGRSAWDELQRGDWVTVSWRFVDNPRKAYRVVVLPPRDDD